MPLTQIGPRAFHKAVGVSSVTLTPLNDRANVVRRIEVTNQSASDTWVLSINGQDLGHFYELSVGQQQLFGSITTNYPKTQDLFTFLKDVYDVDLVYPVPNGTTLTLSSVGGATANILIEYTENVSGEVTPAMLNHPQGNRKIMPVYAYRAAAVAAIGEVAFDTQVAPTFIPTLFIDENLPSGWNMRLLGLFMQGMGVNTYSGAADHLSVTDHLTLIKNGQRMFTRDATDGIPSVGAAAAAGSANKVYGSVLSAIPAFQNQVPYSWDYFDPPLHYNVGDSYQWRLGITGDVTGGADYSTAVLAAIVDITQTGLAG